MTKITYKNEQIKREFLQYLDGGKGFAEDSIVTFAEAITRWQEFSENEDFGNFNKSKALNFRSWLKIKKAKNESGELSLVTQYNYLRRIKRFFKWLSNQPSYKNRILKNDLDFLRLSKKEARISRQGTTKKMPTFKEIKSVINSIKITNEIDMRDRALLSFSLITGIRISAITTLKMKNFNKQEKIIDQNPADGVKTKNSKRILTTFFPIKWEEPEKYFMEWYEHLEEKGFSDEDPIFPATLNAISKDKKIYSKELVDKRFWSGTNSARKIFEKRCKNADVPYYHPHSFRHLIVSVMSKAKLTEEEKKAISLNLGHANTGTTFGSYGYGNMTDEDAVEIVKKLKNNFISENEVLISENEKAVLEKMLSRF
jgi:integrase